MITFKNKGNFSKTTDFLRKVRKVIRPTEFEKYGKMGVEALSKCTPIESGLTATSWYYEITDENGVLKLSFNNSNIQNGVPIAIILQYGHATRNGGWVEGRDYINPAIQPVFDEIAKNAWREVTKL